ncbi:MAG: hypothetical protein IPK63_18615 [Candidatus Competibacteraceae bacterium]|nr:hypothetical protein [Candidatus Competibacteraceae bacterium]
MAKRANLAGKDLWKQYPRAMLRARVISEGIRTVYPGVLSGMYTPEEVRDFIEVQGEAETSGPTTAPPPPPEEIARDYDGEIQAFTDKTALRTWLADQRKANNWKPDHPVYSTLKAACAERAAIDADAKKLAEVQAADDFDAGLGPVEDLGRTGMINITNIGPIAAAAIPVPEDGGVVVLRGRNGSGKSIALDAVNAAVSGRGKPPLKDLAGKGEVQACGATMTVGRTVRRAGRAGSLDSGRPPIGR